MTHEWIALNRIAGEIKGLLESPALLENWRSSGLDRIGPRNVTAVVTGALNGGKTTLVNALIGRPGLLPTSVEPSPPSIVEMYAAERDRFEIAADNHRETLGSHEDFVRRLTEARQAGGFEVKRAFAGLESFPFPNGILVDTPGANVSADIALLDYVRAADAVIFVFNAGFAGQRDDLERLRAVLSRIPPRFAFLVFNHAAPLTEDEREAVRHYTLERIAAPEPFAGVFFTEAALACKAPSTVHHIARSEHGGVSRADHAAVPSAPVGRASAPAIPLNANPGDQEGGVIALRDSLRSFIESQGQAAVRNHYVNELIGLAAEQRTLWQDELAGLGKTEDELNVEIATATADIQSREHDLQRQSVQLRDRIRLVGLDNRLAFQRAFDKVRCSAEDSAENIDDAKDEAQRNRIASRLTTMIDEVVDTTVHDGVVALRKEIGEYGHSHEAPDLPGSRLTLPDARPADIEKSIAEAFPPIAPLLEHIAPYFRSVMNPRRPPGGPIMAPSPAEILIRMLLSLWDGLSSADRDTARQDLKAEMERQLSKVYAQIDDELIRWWESAETEIPEKLRKNRSERLSGEMRPLLAARDGVRRGLEEVNRRRDEVTRRAEALKRCVNNLEVMSHGAE